MRQFREQNGGRGQSSKKSSAAKKLSFIFMLMAVMRPLRINRKALFATLFVCVVVFLLLRKSLKSVDRKVGVQDANSASSRSLRNRFTSVKNIDVKDSTLRIRENAVEIVATVLVIACNRPEVRRCLDSLLKYRTSEEKFPIIVSQDCGHKETARAITSYGKQIKYIKHPDLSDIVMPGATGHLKGYFKLSRHFKWALTQVFDVMHYDTVIVVEDDLEVAPDFFEYFEATEPLLEKDPSLWCVSAWNDNGKTDKVRGNDLLYRSDFFPGLGWMLRRTVWHELSQKWPAAFWDDWMRHPDQRRERACIRPEIPRVVTFGKEGVSNGQFFDEHLKYIKLNDEFYPFTKRNLTFLLKEEYDPKFINTVYKSPLVSIDYFDSGKVIPAPSVRVQYESEETFVSLAKEFGIMDDVKAGVPRMAYRGIVSFMLKSLRVYLAPPRSWRGYEYHK